jgi:NAD(P)-dependent dehydrogenase (short-subunit alcohol dehydrogenase family)
MAESIFRKSLLEVKVAVVTGGGSGINLGIAKRFSEHGAKVVLIGRKQEKLDAAVAEIVTAGGTAMGCSADVRDYAALESAFAKTREVYGEVDVLVCGAAGNFPAPAIGMSANGFKAVVDIDLLGTFNTCRASFGHLKKPGASIINISAPQALAPMLFQSHVCAAKAGVDMITRTLAMEWGPLGVRVNSIVPGPTADTEGMRRLTPSAEAAEKLKKAVPLQRLGTKDELADLALFLTTEAAAYITGAVMLCDGGQSLVGSGIWTNALMGG